MAPKMSALMSATANLPIVCIVCGGAVPRPGNVRRGGIAEMTAREGRRGREVPGTSFRARDTATALGAGGTPAPRGRPATDAPYRCVSRECLPPMQ